MEKEAKYWMIYTALVGWTLHPGYKGRGLEAPSFQELAWIARIATKAGERQWQELLAQQSEQEPASSETS